MKRVLKKIEGQSVYEFLKEKFENLYYLPDAIFNEIRHTDGDFYVVVPEDTPENFIYQFSVGGQIIPFHKKANQNVYQINNLASDVLEAFLNQFINTQEENCVVLEDFNSEPDDEIIKTSSRKFNIVNNHLVYVIDSSYTQSDISNYLWASRSWIFFGVLLSLNKTIIDELKNTNHHYLPENLKNVLEKEIRAFFIEVYDGESFLFWIRRNEKDVFQLLNKQLLSFKQ